MDIDDYLGRRVKYRSGWHTVTRVNNGKLYLTVDTILATIVVNPEEVELWNGKGKTD